MPFRPAQLDTTPRAIVKEQEINVPPKKSFFQRVSQDVNERRKQLQEGIEAESRGQQTKAETILQSVGRSFGLIGDVVGEAIISTARGVSKITPDFIENPIKNSLRSLMNTSLGQNALNALNTDIESYKTFREKNPRFARDLESVLGIGEVALDVLGGAFIVKAGKLVTKKAAKEIAPIAGKGAVKVEERLAKQISQESIDITKPTLTKTEKAVALEAGRGEKGLLRTPTLQPSSKDIRVAKSVENVVNKSNSPIANIEKIREKIVTRSEEIAEGLRGNNAIFNKNQLRSKLDDTKEGSRIIFGTDKTLESAYDSVIDEFIKVVDKRPKTISELLEARKDFDRIVKQKFPKVFDRVAGDNVRANAIMDVRRAANDFIADQLPSANKFKDELLEVSDMFTANKNIAFKTADIIDKTITDRLVRFLRSRPEVTIATGGILTFGALTGLITSPVVLGSLIAFGSFKLGKLIITSKAVKQQLIRILRAMEKTGKKIDSRDRNAMQSVINQLPE